MGGRTSRLFILRQSSGEDDLVGGHLHQGMDAGHRRDEFVIGVRGGGQVSNPLYLHWNVGWVWWDRKKGGA